MSGGYNSLIQAWHRGRRSGGYTIVEVMIFMAVSGLMFVAAAVFINGKQAQVEFKQGLSAANSQLGTIINEVSNGEYNSLGNSLCQTSPGPGQPQFISSGTGNQGNSYGCIFLGKVIQYNVGGDSTSYNIYSIAGRQFTPNTINPVGSFAEADPIPIDPNVSNNYPNLTISGTLQNGTQINGLYQCQGDCTNSANNSRTQIGAFGIFDSFSSSSSTMATAQDSGSQSIVVATVPVGGTSVSHSTAVNTMIGSLSNVTVNSDYILLCFKNGSKSGSITVGGINGQQFTTSMQVGGYPTIC